MYNIMTPGPTKVRENVRLARSTETTNPDLDKEFYIYYKETCTILSDIMQTKNAAYIMAGEGILGLEAACASITEPGDRVLIIDNGVFGKGFADFVKIYSGETVSFVSDYERPIDSQELRAFLEKDSDFKYATLVHCDTPSGVLNDIKTICTLLDSYGIMTVVDSVAAMFGEYVNVDESKIDILCGGSQKVISAPTGLTMVWVSDRAIKVMENRKTPIASFYANILNFKNYYKDQWFPYTMPISDIKGLRIALENYLEEGNSNVIERHKKIGEATRKAVEQSGLELYLKDGYSNTVTVIKVPEGLTDRQILTTMRDKYNVMIAGSFDVMAGRVLRIGHMGENATRENMIETMNALGRTMKDLGFPLKCDLTDAFLNAL